MSSHTIRKWHDPGRQEDVQDLLCMYNTLLLLLLLLMLYLGGEAPLFFIGNKTHGGEASKLAYQLEVPTHASGWPHAGFGASVDHQTRRCPNRNGAAIPQLEDVMNPSHPLHSTELSKYPPLQHVQQSCFTHCSLQPLTLVSLKYCVFLLL